MKLNETVGTYVPDNLIAGTQIPALSTTVTIKTGQNLKRGSVLGIITAETKALLVDTTAADGSKLARYVLAEDTDASLADVEALVYKSGQFCSDMLIVADGQSIASFVEDLRDVNIYVESCK